MRILFAIVLMVVFIPFCNAQNDRVLGKPISINTTAYNPRIAIIRSAMFPGWGQITNKKIWKVPLVYTALGTTTFLFFRNLRQFRDSRDAFRLATDGDPGNDEEIKQPYYTIKNQPERIRVFRNQVRQNMDYCVLFFTLMWGLNVADAAVDAHLKNFDISENLSLRLKAGYSETARTSGFSISIPLGK